MSQYAYKPDAKTIHSKSQMEHFSCLVYDSTLTGGGRQSIITPEGYVIPLHVHNGLCYMDLTPATDTPISTYPNVFLTTDTQWNPDIVDEEFFIDHSSLITDLPDIQQQHDACDSCLDAFGDFNTLSVSSVPTTQACHAFVPDTLLMSPQQMKHHLPDIDILLPNFGWVGKDRIRDTLVKTSQYYKADQCVPMWKHFHSRFPPANVCHLHEWYSTNTLIANIPATDDGVPGHGGCTMLQVYSGLDSELLYGWPLSSESELPDILCDFIHEYGTMDGLMSDNAKSETSFAMKDIFHIYLIKDHQI